MKPQTDKDVFEGTARQRERQEMKPETRVSTPFFENPRIERITSFIEVISDSSTIKSIKPRNFYDQIKLEDDGANGNLWVNVQGLTNTASDNWKKISLS